MSGVVKRFGSEEVLRGCDLEIADGEFVVLVGPSGSGKTTLLRIVAGLEEVSGGEVRIGERIVTYLDPKDRDVAMVFQNYALYPHMSVYENIAFALRRQHVPKREVDQRVREAARMLAIEHLLKRKPKQLSGGQRQRVALGRAIVRHPSAFLMDEPLSNLDAHLRAEMRAEILKLHRRLGATFIFVTHDQVEALTMGDRIVVMAEGQILQVGTPDELYLRPRSRFVGGFIGSPRMGFVESDVVEEGGRLRLRSGPLVDVAVPARLEAGLRRAGWRKATVGLRPDHLGLGPSPAGEDGGAIKGTVEVVEPLGAEQHVLVRVGESTLTAKLPRTDRVKAEDTIELHVTDPSGVHIFNVDDGKACDVA